tara:strand:+ start:1130 stop:1321 length:192 start_codon:yes stop_codon:yes gene_type:complete
MSHRFASNVSARPGGLEVEAAGDAVDVQALSGEVQAVYQLALHGFEIDFLETDAAAGDELILP